VPVDQPTAALGLAGDPVASGHVDGTVALRTGGDDGVGSVICWATHNGAELDLLIVRGNERIGFEIKRLERSHQPVSTKFVLH